MITADLDKRKEKLSRICEILGECASPEDLPLVLSFAPVVFAATHDRIAMDLPAEAMSERILGHFKFIAREIPPSIQLYKGLPGIHVSVRNPSEEEATATGAGLGLPLETTVVETHTLDVPFVFDSLKNYFRRAGLQVFSAVHPIFTARRQWERVVSLGGPHEEGAKEVYCKFEIEPVDSKERRRRIEHEIFSVLKCVFLAFEDFHKMLNVASETATALRSLPLENEDLQAASDFLEWLADDNYIFMGTAKYRFASDGGPDRIQESLTGVFTDESLLPVVFPGVVEELESQLNRAPKNSPIVNLDFCKNSAAIYHLESIDGIIIQEQLDGRMEGATLLLGRFSSMALGQRADQIPILREKANWLLEESDAVANSYVSREIRTTFNHLPMCELLYADPQSLKEIIDSIVSMMGDDEIAVHCRPADGYISLCIAFSRLRYSYSTEALLLRALSDRLGPISFHTSRSTRAASIMLFYFDSTRLEHEVVPETVREITAPIVSTWESRVAKELQSRFGEREGRRFFRRYVRPESRSGLYREVTSPEQVPDDLWHLQHLEGRLEVRVMRRSSELARLNLYSEMPLGLTDTLRTLQNLGLEVTDEMRVPLVLPEGRKCYLYRFELQAPAVNMSALFEREGQFADALRALDEERTTDDPLNGLILRAGLAWREVELLRTVRNHLLQIRPNYNAETVNGVLLRNSGATTALYHSFSVRFDPRLTEDRAEAMERCDGEVQQYLEQVHRLSEDEVLRGIQNLIQSSVRTNFFQLPERPVVSIKVDCRMVEGMGSPRPMYEIYVHSRMLEGIHLRGGPVARGGIRWSDRPDDFRVEVLGLMKTQMVKNTIIVPVGAKGGFVLKGNYPSGPGLDTYLLDRYREFISGLLDVTDNIVDGRTLHPPEVVRHDGDDAYLVVAADKGTAHLSDTANSVSSQYGFWLDDAFASGGSTGYDHKRVGITARGAWECAKHHFANLGTDIQTQPFTVCGIGDLSGDVFGNGVLESRTIRLVAAFNHMHIFIDPDPGKSYQERQRLFGLPRSTWDDYARNLISRGGGVFDRSAKAIPLSAEVKKLLDLEGESVSGEEMIRRILMARVDLLYNGGIGTYVKASMEEDADVGDRANDRVRIDGRDVGARVVVEGGNLGFTQTGRIEYWYQGGLINTDAIDNSGGVDMSDREINIKILLDVLVKKGILASKQERNQLLAEMTEEVATLVLRDNLLQARAVTLDNLRSRSQYKSFVARIDEMVGGGILNRSSEGIPVRVDLMANEERGDGLPRPLLAVLLGYTKMWAYQLAMYSHLPDSEVAWPFMDSYFPKKLRDEFSEHFESHALRKEIVVTEAVNHIVNHGGITMVPRLMSTTKSGMGDVIATYLGVERESKVSEIRTRFLESDMDARTKHEALVDVETVLERSTREVLQGNRSLQTLELFRAIESRFNLK